MSYFATSFAFIRHILDDHPVQTVSIAAMLVIQVVSLLYANDSFLLVGAQGLAVLFLLPFGFKLTFIYFLFYIVCATCRATPPPRTSDPARQAVSETAPDTDWRPMTPTLGRRYLRPLTIQLQLAKGWSIDVHFSLEVPHVVFGNYHIDYARWLNQNLEKQFRPWSSQVSIEFIVNPADRTWDTDTFLSHGEHGCDARFKLRYHEHRAKSVYEFALTQELVPLPLEAIPPQFRKGGAGGQSWHIKAPSFSEFQRFLKKALYPERKIEDIPGDYEEIGSDSRRSAVDLAQARAPIIVPVLKAIYFESNLIHGGTIGRSFEQITWEDLTHISLNSISLLGQEYIAILHASHKLKSFIIVRPGEGIGAPGLPAPTGLVKPQHLNTLHLINCRKDMRPFLSAATVDLGTVKELVVSSCPGTLQTMQANDMGVNWTGIRTLKLSNTFDRQFIEDCRRRLPGASTIEVIPM
ncbi:hypothetical protein DFH05DRAFT_909942 [Lentinula detonsa]|uniref:Uncharacterized protein n=1 Tax=Lentinula detonsa TaxID=2804962 RepID=A0A9W8P3E5_9AGAR|nr:hypothetical protein DFH05DRAFT_909942 [Lentinula detonsa]